MSDISFDGMDVGGTGQVDWCDCGVPYHSHDKERVYPDDGPSGSYHYNYICP